MHCSSRETITSAYSITCTAHGPHTGKYYAENLRLYKCNTSGFPSQTVHENFPTFLSTKTEIFVTKSPSFTDDFYTSQHS